MFRIRYIAILVLSFLFFSCGSLLDLDNINFSLDKNIYNIDEDIVLSYDGHIANARGNGFVYFNLQLVEAQNEPTSASIRLVDSGNLIEVHRDFLDYDNKELNAYIIKEANINNFAGQITMQLDKPGDYVFSVTVGAFTNTQPDTRRRRVYFSLPFKITASE